MASVNGTTDTLKKPRLWQRTDRAWFSRLLRHPARKRSGSILTTPEPTRGEWLRTLVDLSNLSLFYWSYTVLACRVILRAIMVLAVSDASQC